LGFADERELIPRANLEIGVPSVQTETPRLEPGRSFQQGYCTIRVIQVRLKNQKQKKERRVKTRSLKTEGCGTRPRNP
jgi:hypothetical protein